MTAPSSEPAQLTLDDLWPPDRPEWEDELVATYLLPPIGGLPPDKPFVDDVRRWGVIEPVVLLADQGGAYVVADGRRRIQAARLAELTDVPARVLRTNGFAGPVLTLSCNARRSANPASELAAIEALLQAGADEKVIAKATGLSVGTVRQRLRLRHLNDAIRIAFDDGAIGVSLAMAAARLPRDVQDRLADKRAAGERLTMADVEEERRARAKRVVAVLPDELFADEPAVEAPAPDFDQAWIERLIAAAEEAVQAAERAKTVVSKNALAPLAAVLAERGDA